jgi:ABC-type sugar transport system substrate-binding protein
MVLLVVATAYGGASAFAGSSSTSALRAGQAASGKHVFILGCTNANPWCNAFNKTMRDGFKKQGVKVSELTANFDAVVQAQQARQAISQRPDAILVHVADPTAAVPWMQQAKAAGIKVIAVDSGMPDKYANVVAANLMPDMCAEGRFGALSIQDGLREQGITKGNVMAFTGAQSQWHVQLRLQCFKQQLAKTPGLKLVELHDVAWDPVKTATIAQQLLAKWRGKGGMHGVYGMADYLASAVARVAVQMDVATYPKTKPGMVVVGSAGCSSSGMKAIAEGTMYAGGTQSPILEGQEFVQATIRLLNGQKVGKVRTLVERFTRKNAKKFVPYCSYGA